MTGEYIYKYIDQFDMRSLPNSSPGTPIGGGHMLDGTGEVIDIGAYKNVVQIIAEEVMETIEWSDHVHAEPYVIALLDSTLDSGFLGSSIFEIPEIYANVLLERLDVNVLEIFRNHIMTQGPIVGLCSNTVMELRYHCVAHLYRRSGASEGVQNNRVLSEILKQLRQGENTYEADLGAMLFDLAKILYQRMTDERRLTKVAVRKYLQCDSLIAAKIADLYNCLPGTPLWF